MPTAPGTGAADLPRDTWAASQAGDQRLALSLPSKTRRPLSRQGAGSEAVTLGDEGGDTRQPRAPAACLARARGLRPSAQAPLRSCWTLGGL